ncbi:MAG: anti-sigma factor antagonist [Oscillospiraceae bacterium]|nr:anti-sigma factor antagonist [Oscillospiraceae bacterium]
MTVALQNDKTCLIAALSGELDHHSVRNIREEIDTAISEQQPEKLALDFGGVTFMDSSGIGLILGRCKIMGGIGGTTAIWNPPPHIRRVMKLSGIERIARIEHSPDRKENLS